MTAAVMKLACVREATGAALRLCVFGAGGDQPRPYDATARV